MHCIFRIIATALTYLLLFAVLPVAGQELLMPKVLKPEEWNGQLGDGTKITREELGKIIEEHQKWIVTNGDKGQKADLSMADLRMADLSMKNLRKANLVKADLRETDLREADLSFANLTETDLSFANLIQANLYEANLSNAKLSLSHLSEANFAIKPKSLPYIPSIASANGLSKLRYGPSTHALVELRKAFKEAGLRTQEREITYALKYGQRRELCCSFGSTIWAKLESLIYLIFFEWTCAYGMRPGRCFLILIGLIFLFTIPYTKSLSRKGEDGIWVVWIEDRVRKDLGRKEPVRLMGSGWSTIKWGFYFSILSAFSIGWREINVGNWIARMQRREYTLRATGWVRTVSGIQSLTSVYLLALWVLTYFGRPFEAV